MLRSLLILFIFAFSATHAQIDTQTRYTSDTRQYYIWSDASNSYVLRETEYEHSTIDIRELGSKSNGYVTIAMVDDGISRLFHGSITAYSVNEKGEPTWQMRSKIMKGKLTFNPEAKTFTYVYDASEKRYQRIMCTISRRPRTKPPSNHIPISTWKRTYQLSRWWPSKKSCWS